MSGGGTNQYSENHDVVLVRGHSDSPNSHEVGVKKMLKGSRLPSQSRNSIKPERFTPTASR